MEQSTPHLCLYCNESTFRLLCHSNDRIELCLFGYDRNCGGGRVSMLLCAHCTFNVPNETENRPHHYYPFWLELICCYCACFRFFVESDLASLFPVQFTFKILCLNCFGKHTHTDEHISLHKTSIVYARVLFLLLANRQHHVNQTHELPFWCDVLLNANYQLATGN